MLLFQEYEVAPPPVSVILDPEQIDEFDVEVTIGCGFTVTFNELLVP